MRGTVATLAAFAAITAPAAAQATATATPNGTGAPTVLHVEFDATQPPVSGRLPEQTVLSLQKGFRLDVKAIAKRCTLSQAQADDCPARSAIGTALVVANYAGTDYQVPVQLFLARPQQKGDVAGFAAVAMVLGSPQAVMGRIVKATTAPFGLSVILPSAGDLSAFPVTFKSLTADVGGKSRRVKKKRHYFLRTPKACNTAWASNAVFTFADGSTATLDAPIACSG